MEASGFEGREAFKGAALEAGGSFQQPQERQISLERQATAKPRPNLYDDVATSWMRRSIDVHRAAGQRLCPGPLRIRIVLPLKGVEARLTYP